MAFTTQMHHLSSSLTQASLTRMEDGEKRLRENMDSAAMTAWLLFFLMVLLWLALIWTTSRFLATVSGALTVLAGIMRWRATKSRNCARSAAFS